MDYVDAGTWERNKPVGSAKCWDLWWERQLRGVGWPWPVLRGLILDSCPQRAQNI